MPDVQTLLTKIMDWLTLYGLRLVGAIALLIVGRIVAGIFRSILKKLMRKSKVDETLISFVASVSYTTLMVFIIIAALGAIGVQTASFVAVLGAAGLAVGLALQGSLANFASGVLMIIFKPFKVGDYVEGGGTAGSVEEIGIFTTTLNSPDNKKIIVPNAKMTSDNITNYSAREQRRVDIVAGVSYKENLDNVRKVLQEILSSDERILQDPAPSIGVLELAESCVKFAVRPWVKTADYWDVYFYLQETIKKRFDKEGISIPFPQQDIHLHKID
ncbi:MAG: mechanosensitive ion channel [Candidatus Marinimicrobia bacterium]|nr:mechanosensitive ion channel [Candidatus Neomarinimicrobiota bacterium]